MDSLQILVAGEYMKLRDVKVMEEKIGLNMADTLDVMVWASLAWRKSDILSGMVEEERVILG